MGERSNYFYPIQDLSGLQEYNVRLDLVQKRSPIFRRSTFYIHLFPHRLNRLRILPKYPLVPAGIQSLQTIPPLFRRDGASRRNEPSTSSRSSNK
jgi:hypothetical protein